MCIQTISLDLNHFVVINWIDKNPEQQVVGSLYVFLTWLSISIGLVSVVAFLVAFIEVCTYVCL